MVFKFFHDFFFKHINTMQVWLIIMALSLNYSLSSYFDIFVAMCPQFHNLIWSQLIHLSL